MRAMAEIMENSPAGGGVYKMTLCAPEAARTSKPGQFVHIALPDGARILRRPISICDVEGDNIIIFYALRGEGTRILSELPAGVEVDILAPLGHGFELEGFGNIAVVGGGIGIFPLLMALKASKAAKKTAFLGFRGREQVLLLEEFGEAAGIHIATEDGSMGHKGFVTGLLAQNWDGFDSVLACGPTAMLRAVNSLCAARGIDPQVSVEERMGCGLGGCLVCACAVKDGDGGTDYAHVCTDGPVFYGSRLVWEVE